MKQLPHTERIEALLRLGYKEEARLIHNEYVKDQFKKAEQGHMINLSDLIAGKEAFIIDEIERGES